MALEHIGIPVHARPGRGQATALKQDLLAQLTGEEVDQRLRRPRLVAVGRDRQVLST
nr:hypothetical protein [Rhizocola hellebori]